MAVRHWASARPVATSTSALLAASPAGWSACFIVIRVRGQAAGSSSKASRKRLTSSG